LISDRDRDQENRYFMVGLQLRHPVSVIAIHGGPGMDCSYFHPYLDDLQNHYHTRFLDLVGCSVPGFFEQITSLIEILPSRRVVLLGHSFGAALAVDYISQNPGKIRAGVLIAPIYDTGWIEIFNSRFGAREESLTLQIASEHFPTEDAAFRESTKAYVDLYFHEDYLDMGLRVLDGVRYDKKVYERVRSDYTNSLDLRRQLELLPIPALFIAGENDQIVPAAYVAAGARRAPQSSLQIIPKAGHFPFVEKPKQVVKAITDFISSS